MERLERQALRCLGSGQGRHGRLLAECEDTSDEIDRFKRCIDILRSVAMTVPVLPAILLSGPCALADGCTLVRPPVTG
ncbi:hypothetical protein AB0D10_45675 [Kitasatospora sp. NPDC048545]|uniref:hypothetical protein n=1 Tax=Kitasatospora sp. NPDC048545 TaxID=3157208 RepID=UPI003406BEBE